MSLNIQTTFQTVEDSEAHQEAPLSSFIITKSQVTKAGSTIRNYVLSQGPNSESVQLNVEEEFKNALVILKRFREIYSPYLKLLESLLERKLKRLGLFDDSFIAARTKRLDEPPRDCRRLIFLREYDNENTKLYPRNERASRPYAN